MRGKNINIHFILIACFTLFLSQGKAISPNSNSLLRKVELLKIRNQNKLKNTDKMIHKLSNSPDSKKQTQIELIRNITRRQEFLIRHDFLSRLLLKVDSYYSNQNLSQFLIQQLSEMAEQEAKSAYADETLIRFILNCKDVLLTRPKEHNNPIEIIEKYMNFTSITKMKTSALFYEEQDYSNGTETFKANEISTEEIGAVVEEKINNAELNKARPKKPTNGFIDLPPEKSEQELTNKRIQLEDRLKNSNIDLEKVEKPLKGTRKIKPSNNSPTNEIMNQDQFNKLFNTK